MKKNKIYLILAIITLLLLFTTGALCNQCSTAEGLLAVEEEPPEEEPPEEVPPEEVPPEEEPPEEVLSEEEPPEEEPPDEELSEPTISLEIYEGPLYSEADGVCYYRVKAIATGNPTPTVDFSKDDSSGAWGPVKCQINLNSSTETYILTAKATNSEGFATDSLTLTWGCEEDATPDGDGDTIIEGLDPELELSVFSITLKPKHVGYAIKDDGANNSELIIGDSVNNSDVKGFFSFDLDPLAGKTIESAKLILKLPEGVEGFGLLGNPSFKGKIKILMLGYPVPLEPGDYSTGGLCIEFRDFSNSADPIEYSGLTSYVDLILDSGNWLKSHIVYENQDSDGDFSIDGRRYRDEDISLIIGYSE